MNMQGALFAKKKITSGLNSRSATSTHCKHKPGVFLTGQEEARGPVWSAGGGLGRRALVAVCKNRPGADRAVHRLLVVRPVLLLPVLLLPVLPSTG